MMKSRNTLFALIAISTTLLISCSGDEDSVDPSSGLIVGSWELTGMDYTGTSLVDYAGLTAETSFVGTGVAFDCAVEFGENPNTVSSSGSYTIQLETTFEGETVVSEVTLTDVIGAGTWEIQGNKLVSSGTNTVGGVTQVASGAYDILELTQDILRFGLDTTIEQSQAGAELVQSIDISYTLRRQ